MSFAFSTRARQVLAAGFVAAFAVFAPPASGQTAQSAAGTGGAGGAGRAETPPPRAEASPAALALFLADPAGFLSQEGDLAALIASVALTDPGTAARIAALASAEGVSAEQAEAIGAGLAQAASRMTAEGNFQQGTAILVAVAQSPSAGLAAGFTAASGDVETAAINPAAPGASGAGLEAPDAAAGGGAADIGGGAAAAGGTPATGGGVPGGNSAGGVSGSTPGGTQGGGRSGGSSAGGVPGGAVSPAG
ncbi:hypothetical protein K3555_24535 (plasmid) [Leisingera sp. M527]|uniref:hypothetical protein n=1 Tax=Leisingera sp. M527 TaxID=2867014 RepID=UPI0021A55C81|nr:hypothetical protein [Leisingera sp. M527]UWQ35716.1 hypothetical protein K3555_24535 [Leisingera sp. M527]